MLLFSCSRKHNNIEDVIENENLTILASTNANDPIIAHVYSKDGDTIYIMGTKDQNGFATGLSDVIIKGKSDVKPTEIRFENNKPTDITASNGVRMIFDWLTENSAALTLVDPNSGEQLNTIVYFGDDTNKNMELKSISSPKKRLGKTKIDLKPITSSDVTLSTKAVGNVMTGNVYLKQCDVKADAQCWVSVYNYSDMTGSYGRGWYRGTFQCKKIATGHYQYSIPSGYHEHHDIADYCDNISTVMGYICEANNALGPGKQYICLSISGALASGVVTVPVALLFEAACSSVSVALDLYCATLGFGVQGGPSVSDGLCNIIRDMDLTWDTPLYLVAYVNALPEAIMGSTLRHEAGSNLDDLYVTWGGKPGINSFTLNPPAPIYGQDYNAIAELYCLPLGTIITIDIEGTDGYSDSKTVWVDNQINYQCTLTVPGADSGVRDVCTITLQLPDGSVITKKASLIFQ